MAARYKFVEVSPVTEETLEAAVNEWVGKGWHLDAIRFVTTEHSKRPQLAFVSFLGEASPEAPAEPKPPVPEKPPVPDSPPRVITAPHGTDVD